MKDLVKKNLDLALLLIRVALGLGFMAHGISKWQNIEGTMMFFGSQGIPSALAYLVAAVETLGGLAMILGLYTEIAGLLLACVMVVAIVMVKADKGWGIMNIELELSYLMSALAIVLAGPGKHTVMSVMARKGPMPSQPGSAPQS